MVKCPFCQYDNEDGALFCEQCKSDLGALEPVPMAQPVVSPAEPVAAMTADAIPMTAPDNESVPLAGIAEPPFVAAPLVAIAEFASATPPTSPGALEPTIPMAAPVEELMAPPMAAPVAEATPVELPSAAAEPAQAAPAPAAAVPEGEKLPPGIQPKLVVMRGLKIGVEYPLYDGLNFIGRADEKPVDIDLDDQESPERVWSSRQHALITLEDGQLVIEDLNSANGTFVNRTRVYPGQKRALQLNDVIQIGTVQLKVKG